ncbi:MAG TPA: hypothetical protein VFW23_04815 [Tepidisphaeraceae bacterium]|nr:hypothetical protein [Tepidisphaeraceae bacterium]
MTTKTGLPIEIENQVAAMALEDSHLKGWSRWVAYEVAKRRVSRLCGRDAPEEKRSQDNYEIAMRHYVNLVQL